MRPKRPLSRRAVDPVCPPTEANIAKAAALLANGDLVAFPTETVYGLGADATDERAVRRLFEVKGRPADNPLIVHLPSAAEAARHVVLNALARRLAARFWPGPLTLVLPLRADCPVVPQVSAGLTTLALRVPALPLALELLRRAARPIAAPSANRSGRISPTTAGHVAEELDGEVAMILDGGPCPVGVESTVVAVTEDQARLLRPGGVTREAIEEVAGLLAAGPGNDARPQSPGMLASHYAPALPLRLNAQAAGADEALLAFGPDVPAGAARTLNLSPDGDLGEAAGNLFAMLRALDRPGLKRIAVMAIPESGLGLAINDRLRRAAARPDPPPL